MKKIISILLATLMFATFAFVSVSAAETTPRDEFKTLYSTYTNYYDDEYKPVYDAYYAKMDKLAKAAKTLEGDKLEDLYLFVTDMKTAKKEFFGNKKTIGTSREEVRTLRKEMTKAYNKGDFALAYEKCADLKYAVESRVFILKQINDMIDTYITENNL
ncbi:MAG: hypothetical protein RRY76_03745 [Clostridia bacterium]